MIPIFKNNTKTTSIKTLNQENCEKCLSTDHKQHCPEIVNEKFEKLENMVQYLCEQVGKTVLAFQPKNTQTQENSEKRQKFFCQNHPNSNTHHKNEYNRGNFKGDSSQSNQRSFQSNNYSSNSRNHNRRFGNNPNNNSNNNYNYRASE